MSFRRCPIPALTLLAVLVLPAVACAATLVGVLTEESFGSSASEGGFAFATIAVGVPEDFVFDFSAEGETEVAFSWRMPTGQRIQIDTPDGASDAQLTARFRAGDQAPSLFINGNVSTDLTPPTSNVNLIIPSASFARTGTGVLASIDLPLEPGQRYLFSELTLSFTIPATFDGVFDLPVDVFELTASAAGLGTLAPSVGQWMTIVPEPSSLVLLGASGLMQLRRRKPTTRPH